MSWYHLFVDMFSFALVPALWSKEKAAIRRADGERHRFVNSVPLAKFSWQSENIGFIEGENLGPKDRFVF